MDDEKLLERIKRDYRKTVDSSAESRQAQDDDERFAAGSPDNKWQWDSLALATRNGDQATARPALTVNIILQHIRQVTNDERQNRPAVKVLPVDDKADPETAEIFNGLIRHIQVSSDADTAYDTACEHQVTQGEGYFRIVAEYCDPDSFDQDLRFKRVRDWRSVRMDPMIQIPTGEDAKFCFIEKAMTKEEFKASYPEAQEINWDGADENQIYWLKDDSIIVAEYYYVEDRPDTLCAWVDGSTSLKSDKQAEAKYLAAGVKRLMAGGKEVERPTMVPQVCWCITNGCEILVKPSEKKVKDIPGKFIPVFRVVGNEWAVAGQTIVSGIVRNAKDPQRMVNFWWSQEAEMLALAPKAPFVGASGQFDGFESKWKTANQVNYPYLEYNPIVQEGIQVPPPQRMPPPMPAAGVIEAKMQAIDAVKQATGQYDASLGAKSNETSGKAILARQREGDVGTFHFIDNLNKAIRSAGKYLVDTIPVYYDRKRVARIIGEDGEPDHCTIDPQAPQAYQKCQNEQGEIEEIYNPSVGKYDVVSSVGPSYSTKRQESAQFMTEVLQGNPQLMGVMGDLYFKMLDQPGSDEIADRVKRTIPPQILGDDGPDGQPPDPKLQGAMQMVDQLTGKVHELMDALQSKQQADALARYDAKTKRLAQVKDAIPANLWPEIIIEDSELLTPENIDNIAGRIHPQEMQQALQPAQPQQAQSETVQ